MDLGADSWAIELTEIVLRLVHFFGGIAGNAEQPEGNELPLLGALRFGEVAFLGGLLGLPSRTTLAGQEKIAVANFLHGHGVDAHRGVSLRRLRHRRFTS